MVEEWSEALANGRTVRFLVGCHRYRLLMPSYWQMGGGYRVLAEFYDFGSHSYGGLKPYDVLIDDSFARLRLG